MPCAAVIGAALQTGTARTRALFLDGLDVLRQPGNPGGLYGVPIDSINIVERGPGGVSAMTFRVDDPSLGVALADGMSVIYFDLENDWPAFRGWIDDFASEVAFGDQARVWQVSCTGVEAVLDWSLIPADMTFLAGSSLLVAIQSLAAVAVGTGPLRTSSIAGASSIANPVAGDADGNLMIADVVVPAGRSLREAIRQVAAASLSYLFGEEVVFVATVDFFYGLRVYPQGSGATGFAAISLNADTPAGSLEMANLAYRTEGANVRGVFVKGANAAGTGLVPDGSGKLGPIASLSDSSVDSATKLASVAAGYLSQFTTNIRGSFEIQGLKPADVTAGGSHVCAGSRATLTATSAGLSGTFSIFEISKQMHGGGRETWTVSFGGLAPSLTGMIRRLTRDTRA